VKNVIYYEKPEQQLIEDIANTGRECILLFDADRGSNETAARLRSQIMEHGGKVHTRFRKVLLAGKVKELSGLLKFLHRKVATSDRKHKGMPF